MFGIDDGTARRLWSMLFTAEAWWVETTMAIPGSAPIPGGREGWGRSSLPGYLWSAKIGINLSLHNIRSCINPSGPDSTHSQTVAARDTASFFIRNIDATHIPTSTFGVVEAAHIRSHPQHPRPPWGMKIIATKSAQ